MRRNTAARDGSVDEGTVNRKARQAVYNWLRKNLFLLLPPTCRLCGDDGYDGRDLCLGCHRDLPWLRAACGRCALPLPSPEVRFCARCLRRPPIFDAVLSPLRYAPPVDSLIHAFKFREDFPAGRLLAELLAEQARRRGDLPQVLLPLPLHPGRLRERGFNQASTLARWIGRRLDLPVRTDLLARVRDTPPQHDLPSKQRRANVRQAFALRRPLNAESVAVVDDVLTTGNTAAEVARVLRRAGARRVEVWVCARTPRQA